MTPSARIQAVIDILETSAKSASPLDAVIGEYTRSRRYIGSKDRRAVAERVYEIVRAHARLGWWLERTGLENGARSRVLLWLALGERLDVAEMDPVFDGTPYGPALLTDAEKRALPPPGASLESPEMPAAVRVECPERFAEALQALYGDAFEAELRAMLEPGTLDLRVNTALVDRETARANLAGEGVATEPTPFSPWGLRVAGRAQLGQTQAFANGWVEVQDEGSQLIVLACEVAPGMRVLDFCAGAGGKTLGLGAAMRGQGRLVAADIDIRRLEKALPRLAKAGLQTVVELRSLDGTSGQKWLQQQAGQFDVTMVDAPCSGTGTWRRNPDQRWREHGPALDKLARMQAEILDRAAPTVRPGGRLVYATCSILPAENEAQVSAFLTRHPGFRLRPLTDRLAELSTSGMMRLSPARHRTDGFFCAVLERSAL